MKQKDLAEIGIAVLVSIIASVIISGKVISTPQTTGQKVEVVSAISPHFNSPSSQYFNTSSIDPTQLIQIGTNANSSPFGSAATPPN